MISSKVYLYKKQITSMQRIGLHPAKLLLSPIYKHVWGSIAESESKLGTKKIWQAIFVKVYLGCIDKECKKKNAI